MMGEIGNHSFAVGLGISFAFLGSIIGNSTGTGVYGTLIITVILILVTVMLIAFIRRKNLNQFLKKNLNIKYPIMGIISWMF